MTRAADMGWIGCHNCGAVHAPGPSRCRTCGAVLHARLPNSLQKVWAWLLTGVLFLIPANLYPLLSNEIFGHEEGHTILEGIVLFARSGDLLVAGVIFLASFVIPVVKVVVIALLAWSVHFDWQMDRRRRLLLYEFVEFIGRWSMIDVFVVAILSALVQLGFVVSIHPGPAAAAFAISVAFTMLSAQSFDPRLIWRGLPLRSRTED